MHITDAVRTLDRELRDIFAGRLQSLVAYAAANATDTTPAATLAIVDNLTAEDLRACAGRVARWHDAGAATPLLLEAEEFDRSLDVFPLEFGAIIADHALVSGRDPFVGLRVDPADLRRACEVQARSHLLHLREGFIETGGRGDALVELIARSAPPLAALLTSAQRLGDAAVDAAAGAASLASVARLRPVSPQSPDQARAVFPDYLEAVERLTRAIDQSAAQ
jgi:hypothetical protein